MENTLALYQLIVLYLLRRAGSELTQARISEFLMENGFVNFQDLLMVYKNLSEIGYIRVFERGEDALAQITPAGEEALQLFRGQISDRVRERVLEYLKEKGTDIREERSVTGEYYDASYGGYLAHLRVREQQQVLLDVSLHVPSEEMARHFTEQMKKKSGRIYELLMEELLQDDERPSAE